MFAAAGMAVMPQWLNAAERKGKAVGIQLYTLKDVISNNVKEVIENVAKAGYGEVESYGYVPKGNFWGLTPIEFKALLDQYGLKMPSGHYDFESYIETGNLDSIKAYIDVAKTLDSKYITAPWLATKLRKNADDYKSIAEKLNIAGELAKKSGLAIAYHNHDFEFKTFDGKTGLDILVSQTDPKLVSFELDLYWAEHAQNHPLDLFAKYPGRFKMWHVKDMNKLNRNDNTEIGNGTIDFKPIFKKAAASGLEYFFVEQENSYSPTIYDSIKTSCTYIKNKLI